MIERESGEELEVSRMVGKHGFVSRLYRVDQTKQREFTIIVNSKNNCTKGRRTKC